MNVAQTTKVGELLRAARQQKRLSIPDMAKELDVSHTTLAKYERGEGLPDIDFLVTASRVFHLDMMELLRARLADSKAEKSEYVLDIIGDIYKKNEPEYAIGDVKAAPYNDGFLYIRRYDVQAAAGAGAQVLHEQPTDTLAFRADWIRQVIKAKPADLALIEVQGDSMDPTLKSGDTIMVRLLHSAHQLDDGIYVVSMDDNLLVKRLQMLPNGRFRVTSDNEAYMPYEVGNAWLHSHKPADADGIGIVGRVVWSGRRL